MPFFFLSSCSFFLFFLFAKEYGSFLLVPPGHLVSLVFLFLVFLFLCLLVPLSSCSFVFLFLCLLVPYFLCAMSQWGAGGLSVFKVFLFFLLVHLVILLLSSWSCLHVPLVRFSFILVPPGDLVHMVFFILCQRGVLRIGGLKAKDGDWGL